MKEIIAFVCDFCPRKKRFAKRGTALNHERKCFHNPTRRACVTCEHFSVEPAEKPDWHSGYPGQGAAFCCEKGILPIPGYNGEPDQIMTADCEQWELKTNHRE